MSTLTVPFNVPWNIKIPIVIRYLEKSYIDDFFNDGSIMLSSFQRFREHDSHQLGDQNEGLMHLQIQGTESQSAAAFIDGSTSFVLSTAIIESNKLMKELSADYEDGFRIYDTVAFAGAIASKIPGFIGGFQGNCIYRDDLVVRRNNAEDYQFVKPESEQEAEKEALKWQQYMMEQNNSESYFLKPLRYASQNEYRFVWRTNIEVHQPNLLVKCPEALKFCERLGS